MPANYDAVNLAVDPDELLTIDQQAISVITQIGDEITTVGNTMSGLQLSWTGGSATAAQSFSDRWSALMTQMFGPDGDSGVVAALLQAIGNTANNFDSGEQSIIVMFTELHNSIGGGSPGGGGGSGLPSAIENPLESAVGETFPPDVMQLRL